MRSTLPLTIITKKKFREMATEHGFANMFVSMREPLESVLRQLESFARIHPFSEAIELRRECSRCSPGLLAFRDNDNPARESFVTLGKQTTLYQHDDGWIILFDLFDDGVMSAIVYA